MGESTVRCSWRSAGQVALVDGLLVFPRAPDAPGLYRFRLNGPAGTRVYVGESGCIADRFQHYRTPGGPGERRTTKFRLNQLMLGVLSSGGQVTVDVATQAEAVDSDGRPLAISLDQKPVRQRVERAVIAAERASGSMLLNQ
jgi:hypothetical protein